MTKVYLSIVLLLILSGSNLQAQTKKIRFAHIGFIYPLSTNGSEAKAYTNVLSLHALIGVSKSEKSFCAAGLSNVIYDYADGLVLAGLSNHVLNSANGLQAAGFLNTVRNEMRGLQASGFMNLAGNVNGFQCAGFCNITSYDMRGFQTAGFCNITNGNVKGAQAAGFMNIGREVKGTQVSGFMNMAQNVNTQVGGFINIAKEVKGVQLSGFINIADSSDYPIGIINIVKNGEKALGVTVDESGTTLATFRSGGRVLYGIIGAGYNPASYNELFALEAGIGAHLRLSRHFRINFEGATQALTDFHSGEYLKTSVRILPALTIANRVDIFAGPSINHVQSEEFYGDDMSNHYLWTNTNFGSFNGLYIGAMGGIQFHL